MKLLISPSLPHTQRVSLLNMFFFIKIHELFSGRSGIMSKRKVERNSRVLFFSRSKCKVPSVQRSRSCRLTRHQMLVSSRVHISELSCVHCVTTSRNHRPTLALCSVWYNTFVERKEPVTSLLLSTVFNVCATGSRFSELFISYLLKSSLGQCLVSRASWTPSDLRRWSGYEGYEGYHLY